MTKDRSPRDYQTRFKIGDRVIAPTGEGGADEHCKIIAEYHPGFDGPNQCWTVSCPDGSTANVMDRECEVATFS